MERVLNSSNARAVANASLFVSGSFGYFALEIARWLYYHQPVRVWRFKWFFVSGREGGLRARECQAVLVLTGCHPGAGARRALRAAAPSP
ncbi:hypothetical protein SBA4_4730007 [Candidatus Sulfopaludibacter sp. SbA4]|nr:hypothetical protein SBA4_4730007 [Candidatus Sulfopaludibacter sp. SbA4]